jgi:hypothetical protein
MPHPALEAKRAGASVDEHRRARVAQRVKARPRNAGSKRGRDEHAVAQVAGPQNGTLGATDEQRGLGLAGRERVQSSGELEADRDGASAVTGLGRGELSVDDRSAHVDARRVGLQAGVHDAQADRFGDTQARRGEQLEERAPLLRNLRQEPRELRPRQEAPLIELVRTPAATARQQDHAIGGTADQASPSGVAKAGLQRHDRVAHRALGEAVPVVVRSAGTATHEGAGTLLIDVVQASRNVGADCLRWRPSSR